MSVPLVVLVTGPPAAGKSRLAHEAARRLRCPLIAKDAIKEPLLDVLGERDRAWSRLLSDAAFAVAFGLARSLLATGRPFVLEGNFRPGEHEAALRDVAAAARLVQVLCTAPAAVRAARLAARARDPNRHPGHRDLAFAVVPTAGTDAALAAEGGFLDLPGVRITHDSTGDEAGCPMLDELLRGES